MLRRTTIAVSVHGDRSTPWATHAPCRPLPTKGADVATLCRPAVSVPEHVITAEQTLDLARAIHAGHEQLELALRLIANTGVRKRHLIQPLELTLRHPGFRERNELYEREAKARVPDVVRA